MAKCDVCGRPATTQLTVRDGSQTRQINLCDQHYAEAVGEGFGRRGEGAPGRDTKQRIIDVGSFIIVHDVEHPGEIEDAPQRVAP